jgi:hypothetical protein
MRLEDPEGITEYLRSRLMVGVLTSGIPALSIVFLASHLAERDKGMFTRTVFVLVALLAIIIVCNILFVKVISRMRRLCTGIDRSLVPFFRELVDDFLRLVLLCSAAVLLAIVFSQILINLL